MPRATIAVAAAVMAVLLPAALAGCAGPSGAPAPSVSAGAALPRTSAESSPSAAEPTASPVLADACVLVGDDAPSTRIATELADAGLRVRTSAALADLLDTRCALVLSVSASRGEEMLRAAKEHPDLPFAATGVPTAAADPANLARLDSDVSGAAFVAGYLAAASTSDGVVAAIGLQDDPAAGPAVAAFAAGADHRASQDGARVDVRPGRLVVDEARAAQAVQRWADAGVSVVLLASEGLASLPVPAGVRVIGRGGVRPDDALGWIVDDLSVPALAVAQQVADGTFSSGVVEGSLADGGVRLELGDVPEPARGQVDAVAEQVSSGRMAIGSGG